MGSSPTGMALRLTQWFTRAIEFCCAALILSIFSYFFATLRGHSLQIPTWMRAVEGIAGAGVLYTLLCLCLLCCVAGHPFLSSIFILLDICFTGAFIYLAAANRDGASSCNGLVNTPIGRGNSSDNMVGNGQGGTIEMPSLHAACKMQTACLAVAIVGLLFFILSAILEFLLIRHRRKEKRYGASPVNGYTPGYGKTKPSFLSRFRRGNRKRTDLSDNSNVLPAHTHPDDLHRDSYGIEQTRVNTSHGYGHSADPDALPHTHNQPPMSGVNSGYGSYNYKPDSAVAPTVPQDQNLGAYTHHTEFANTGGTGATAPAHYPPGNYRYDDGVYDRI